MLPLLMVFVAARHWSARRMLLLFATINAAVFLWRVYANFRPGYDAEFHQTQYNIDSLLFGVMLAGAHHQASAANRFVQRLCRVAR